MSTSSKNIYSHSKNLFKKKVPGGKNCNPFLSLTDKTTMTHRKHQVFVKPKEKLFQRAEFLFDHKMRAFFAAVLSPVLTFCFNSTEAMNGHIRERKKIYDCYP